MVPPWTPEFLAAAQEEITKRLGGMESPNILEVGAGWSTIWFSLRPGLKLTSFETDPDWYAEISKTLMDVHTMPNVTLLLRSHDELVKSVRECRGDPFDLVLIDCYDELRVPCAEAALPLIKPGGLLVLDDAQWKILRPLIDKLGAWDRWLAKGDHIRKTGHVCYHETMLATKPL
jgi:predicted O-methyltransferase YrrM